MNLINKVPILLFALMTATVSVLSYWVGATTVLDSRVSGIAIDINGSERVSGELRKVKYEEASPDQLNEVIEYELAFDDRLYQTYEDYLSNKVAMAVKDIANSYEDYIFIGEERIGSPHWLGNEHVFFTTYCGTACQGLYLVDTRNKEAFLAVYSYMFSEQERSWYTYFTDWHGQKFKFKGLGGDVRAETIKGRPYLIFQVTDGEGKFIGEKRFLFTGDKLED